ncbi:hypothetical protein KKB54_03000 [bacterium]|nr:hypothetical protein [bacterium]MBU0899765.1 hypothetical protein [bacterium]MBU1153433.1 hypothetical protein [bacterium]MBU2599232.1 hypothetical protein [bacterium]
MKKKDIDVQKVEEVIKFLGKYHLEEIDIKEEKIRIRAKKNIKSISSEKKDPTSFEDAAKNEKKKEYKEIRSPLAGTIYRAPFSGVLPFVEEENFIIKEQTVALVEAMKLFNEIKSEFEGKIVKILFKDGQTVATNQVLFLVE